MSETEVGRIEEVVAPGTEIDTIIVKLEKVLEGDRMDHAIIALVALAIFLMNPKIDQDKLELAIEQVTTFAAMTVADADMNQALGSMQPVVGAAN